LTILNIFFVVFGFCAHVYGFSNKYKINKYTSVVLMCCSVILL